MPDSDNKYPLTIGVLGGMGPAATALAFHLIVQLSPAEKDADHVPVVIYNAPQIPDRTAAILGKGPSPVPALVAAFEVLQNTPAQFAVIPCNTVFHFYPEFAPQVRLPIIHILMPLLHRLQESDANKEPKLGVLCTLGTRASGLYDRFFSAHGFETVYPSAENQDAVMRAIYQLKGPGGPVDALLHAGDELVRRGAAHVILGCTELSLVYDRLLAHLPVIDSTRCLVKAALDVAWGCAEIDRFRPS